MPTAIALAARRMANEYLDWAAEMFGGGAQHEAALERLRAAFDLWLNELRVSPAQAETLAPPLFWWAVELYAQEIAEEWVEGGDTDADGDPDADGEP